MKPKPTYQELEKEIEILKENNNYNLFLDLANVMLISIDLYGIVTYVNKKACEILGCKNEGIHGKNWFDNFVPERCRSNVLNVSKKMLSGEINIAEYNENPILTVKGEERIIKWHNVPIRDEKGNITGHLSSGEDITERIEAEKALKESEKKYRLLTETMKDVVVKISKTGKLLYISPVIKEFAGYIPEEEIGNHISRYISRKKDLPGALKLFADVLNYKKSGNFDFIFKAKNKTPFPVELTYVPLISEGKVSAIQMVLRDNTERRKANQALKESEQKLMKLNAEKDKFFSIIAHDLKNPFNSMLGFSDLLIRNFDKYNNKKKKKYIEIIQQSVQNTYKLLENLLLWSRAQRGIIDFYPENRNLYLLTAQTIMLLIQSAENKSIAVSNQISEDIYVEADENMVFTILRNLISNAIKYTSKGGKISVKAHSITDKNKHSFAEISVKDNGVGIAKETIVKLFTISGNVSTKGTEGEVGTGLGLMLCKEFIEKHRGKLWVESEPNKGSKFIFTLPLSVNA